MTVASTANRKSYAGDGSTTAFTFPYLFLANADLKVILVAADGTETVQTITTHYTLTGAGEPSGGTVTMLTAPAADETLVIYRDPETTQSLDLVTNDALPAEPVEQAFDKLTMLAQRTRELVNRSVHLTDGDDDRDMVLPPVVDRAGKYLGFDEDGIPSAVAGAGDATPISTYGATLVIAADAGAARTVLGLGTMAVEAAADYANLSSSAPFTATQTMPQLAIKAVDADTDPAGYLRDENGAAVGIWFYDRSDDTIRLRHSGNLKDIILYESGGVALTDATGGDPGAGKINAAGFQIDGADAHSIIDYLHGASGYEEYSNGSITQWGLTGVINTPTTITFPTTFATACRSLVITPVGIAGTQQNNADVDVLSTSQFRITATNGVPYFWIAKGE